MRDCYGAASLTLETPMNGSINGDINGNIGRPWSRPALAWQIGVAVASSLLWGAIELAALCRARWTRR
jgi:hypothetical protein